jgi:NADH-quinone oxidoreductase subunit N
MPPQLQSLGAIQTTLGHDLFRFAPELAVACGIVVVLFARMVRRSHAVPLGIFTLITALTLLVFDWRADGLVFDGMLDLGTFALFFRGYTLVTVLLVLSYARLTGFPDSDESADFTTLVLGGTLGMMLMPSANHLLMVFLAVEMASLPSYVLVGFRRNRHSSEASLKYVVYGAAASGVMLYGISLIAGRCGSGYLPMVAAIYGETIRLAGVDLTLAMGTLFVFVGLLFKLAAVPMQVWLPDVFAGASLEVAAILAIASKGAAIGLTIRVVELFGSSSGPRFTNVVGPALAICAMLTATVGNLVALVQTDLKRMWAFSTIAHAGYMLMGVSTCMLTAVPSVLVYLMGYLPMTLGVFIVASLVSRDGQTAEVSACRGLFQRSPLVGLVAAVCLFSLLGLPPLVGFAGKFQVFAATYHAAEAHRAVGGSALVYYLALGVGVVNTVISAGYYLYVLRVITLDDPDQVDEKGRALPLGESTGMALLLVTLAVTIVVGGVLWDPLMRLAYLSATP